MGDIVYKSILEWLKNIPPDTPSQYMENLNKYKEIIDRTPNKFLKQHLDNSIKDEQYELAQHIKDTADKRGFDLKNT